MDKGAALSISIGKSSIDLLPQYIELYKIGFPNASHFSAAYLGWLYKNNPTGSIIGADACLGNEVVGQVLAIPGEYLLGGKAVRGLLAVNVVVHPKFQGRHLFKKLGMKMCEYGAEDGYEFVIGISNAAATPGWVRQMGFQLVQPLEARLGLGDLCIDLAAVAKVEQFSRVWSPGSFAWRVANPHNPVSTRRTGDRVQVYAAVKGALLPVYAELPAPPPAVLQTS